MMKFLDQFQMYFQVIEELGEDCVSVFFDQFAKIFQSIIIKGITNIDIIKIFQFNFLIVSFMLYNKCID